MANQDLTTYTESETSNRLSETSSRVTATALGRSDTTGDLYKDFGGSYFDGIFINFEFVSVSVNSAPVHVMGLTVSATGTINNWGSTDINGFYLYSGTQAYIGRGANAHNVGPITINLGQLYYCTFERLAGLDLATLKIYSDSNRTTQVGSTLTETGYGTATKYRYFHAMAGFYDGNGFVRNFIYSKY